MLSVLSCDKDDDSPVKEETPISYLKSILGGCNNKTEENIELGNEKRDTVIIALTNDTLNIFAGLNYICCAPFVTDCNIKNDSIFITITDTCSNPYQDCYCRCNCYYTFNYYFNSISAKKYYWQIILNDPREENETILKMGIIEVE
jgi:hypothetical protein